MSDYTPRLQQKYRDEVIALLMKEFQYSNPMEVPGLQKIVMNMGLGEAVANAKIIESATDELGRIAGQKPVITRAKKSIAGFKLRQGMPIGAMVTLRKSRMWELADRLISFKSFAPTPWSFRSFAPKPASPNSCKPKPASFNCRTVKPAHFRPVAPKPEPPNSSAPNVSCGSLLASFLQRKHCRPVRPTKILTTECHAGDLTGMLI